MLGTIKTLIVPMDQIIKLKERRSFIMKEKVIGVYTLSNFGGIEILSLEGDMVKWRYNFGEPEEPTESEIFYCVENEEGEEVEGFFANDTLIEFNEILRL